MLVAMHKIRGTGANKAPTAAANTDPEYAGLLQRLSSVIYKMRLKELGQRIIW